MKRHEIIAAIGMSVTTAGLFLAFAADYLATRWQRTESGNGWGGITDPAERHLYQTIGLIALVFGLVMLAMAAWRWLAKDSANRGLTAG